MSNMKPVKPIRGMGNGPVQLETHSDLGNARLLVERYGDHLRYCHDEQTWYFWDERCWQRDTREVINGFAKQLTKDLLEEARRAEDGSQREALMRHAVKSQHVLRIRAMVQLSRSEPEISIDLSAFNKDPFLLNVQNGTIDLRTGAVKPHDPRDLITHCLDIDYDPVATAPHFEAFVSRIMDGDAEMVAYLNRVVGYSLTGSVRDQVMFFIVGAGANGKSTFINAILNVLGTLGKQADPRLLVRRRGEIHPTNIADLAGARFVACSETESNERLAESMVKALTGGDRVKARKMRQDFIELIPTWKIAVVTNHLPDIESRDHGIWRRIHIVNFPVSIPAEEIDKDLDVKLQDEREGILAWAVRGSIQYCVEALNPPARVTDAVHDLIDETDQLSDFIASHCLLGEEYEVQSADLFSRYFSWARSHGLSPVTMTAFGRQLNVLGLGSRKSGVKYRTGIKLKDEFTKYRNY
jgi:putative DNA primase/helicase